MPVIIEDISQIPDRCSRGMKHSRKGDPDSESARMYKALMELPKGRCLTVLPDTDDPKELERKRAHWSNTASRRSLKIITRLVVTDAGDKALRIWRLDA